MLTRKTIGDMCTGLRGLGAMDGCEGSPDGSIWEICFAGGFFIESMDYRFKHPTFKRYHNQKRFMEILCFDSIEAVHRDCETGESAVKAGFSVNLNQGRAGEIRFSSCAAVRGVRIVIAEELYGLYAKERFPGGSLNSELELRLTVGQIKRGAENGIDSESYFKSKIIELLYWITAGTNHSSVTQRELDLTQEDFVAVNKVKSIIDECVSGTSKIRELADLSGTSATKLQNDFKAAFGCTIHEYVQQVRMAEALREIENTDKPLYMIARNVGFKKPGYFSEIFRNTYGITPSEYVKLKKPRSNQKI
jgi:AraC-like DNA-binding protein